MEETLVVSANAAGERLDKFIQSKLNFISRAKINDLIQGGDIKVNGENKKCSYRVKHKDKINIIIEERKVLLKPFPFKVKIIYEDSDVIVIDKPGGLVVHPPQPAFSRSLINALIYMQRELSTVNPLRPGVVHRLDKETSGVMVLAKNNYSHLNLVNQFKDRKVKKEYRGICWGRIEKDSLTIDLPLARDKKKPVRIKVSFLKSKKAFTVLEVIRRFKDATFLSIIPHTGRMHQIRVHLNFLSHPIVGDKKYGIKDTYKELFLHAYKLGFYHPGKGSFLEFTSPLPLRFKEFIKKRDDV
jgi:23S rRNA pseudouridine1911/1915/1917 synthase